MIFDTEDGTRVVQFGEGDVWVAPGHMKDDETVASISFASMHKAMPIGDEPPGWCQGALDTDWDVIPVRFVFTNPASVDVLMWALTECKKRMATKESEGE